MSFTPGHAKAGGKKKGFSKKKACEDIAKKLGVDPFSVLCLFAKGDWQELELDSAKKLTPGMRLEAAKEACKYLHSQKKSLEVANAEGQGFKIEVVDYTTINKE
jgi:hypothetical protein